MSLSTAGSVGVLHSKRKSTGLEGRLEDLPLLDMLQIVAFSKKTGYIVVDAPQGKAGIAFQEGMVHCAYTWSTLAYLRQIGEDPHGGHRVAILQKQIEISLRELASLREGRFVFQVTDSTATEIDGMVIAPFLLHQGINPQALLLELAKEIDEEGRRPTDTVETASTTVPHGGGPAPSDVPPLPPLPTETAGTSPAAPTPQDTEPSILLVDDEPFISQIICSAFRSAGYRVYTASGPVEAAGLASELSLSCERLQVVTDLAMPSSSGRSFRGGFELIRMLRRNGIQAPVLLMTERLSAKARGRANALGIRKIAIKPELSKLDQRQYEKDLQGFATVLLRLLRELDAIVEPEPDRPSPPRGEDSNSAPFLDYIAAMSEQLRSPRRSVEVSQMVLQVASRYLERGVLFLIKGEMACGLSAYGLVSTETANVEVSRKISFNIHQARPFAEVAYSGKAERFSSELDCLQSSLYAAIGRGRATECILMPMMNNNDVLVILYADNARSGRPIGKLRGLELFMGQAGMALENTFLHQKLRVFESKLTMRGGEESRRDR